MTDHTLSINRAPVLTLWALCWPNGWGSTITRR